MKIMLDAGHYGKSNRSPVLLSYYESEMTWKLTNYLKEALEAYGITVGLTRTEQAKDLDVYQRGQMAKGYDLFISIHSNACDTESVDRPTMIVNLDGKTTDLGKALGKVVRETMGTTQDYKIATRQWDGRDGVEYYGVLRGAHDVGVKGIIIEHSFHTNFRSAKWLSFDANLKKMATAEADCIASFYGIKKAAVNAPESKSTVNGTIDGIDRNRGADELILYVRGTNGKTNTNKWGYEVPIDKNGVAIANPVYGVGNMEIPTGGYVLSGHNTAGKWISEHIKKGTKVSLGVKV